MHFRFRLKTALFSGALGVLALASCSKKSAPVAMQPPEVLFTVPVQQDVPMVREWLGTLDGSSNVEIRARVSGYILEQKYSEGSPIKKGDVLFLIDPLPMEAALAQAKASLAQAEAIQGRSQAEYLKQKELWEKKASSQRDFDNANQTNLANMAQIDIAKASVQQAELNLAFTKITAPVDGIAGVAKVGIGDLVSPTSEVLTTMSTVDPIKARFPMSEQEYLGLSKELAAAMARPFSERKARAELVLADGSVHAEKGTFFSVDRQVTIKTGTIAVEVLFPNPGNLLRPGQYARVRAVLETRPGALLVPQRAVMEQQDKYSLALVDADGKAELRPVKVGPTFGALRVISEGLKAGEKVVVEGLQKVRNGVPVIARPWTPPQAAPVLPVAAPEVKPAVEAKPEAR